MDISFFQTPDVGAKLRIVFVSFMPEACHVSLPPHFERALGKSSVGGRGSPVLPRDLGLVDNVGRGALRGEWAGRLVPAVAGWVVLDVG